MKALVVVGIIAAAIILAACDTTSAPGANPTPITQQIEATPVESGGSVVTSALQPGGPLTIVALGDSLTEGDGDYPGDGGGYPARLQRSIDAIRPNSRVINLGKSGWTSEQMIDGQLPAALQARPDIALIWIGSNDLWYNNGPEQEASDVATFTGNIDQTLRSLAGANVRIFIALLDDQSRRPYATSPSGAGLPPEGTAYMSRLGRAFNDVIRAKAAEHGAVPVDFYNTTIFTDPSTLAEDGIHPNPNGYDLIERTWLEHIRRVLQ